MYLQYDNEGDLKTQILHGEPCRQGSLLEVSICFSEEDWHAIIDRHADKTNVSMLLYLVDDEVTNKVLIDENATKYNAYIPYFNGYEVFYKNFDKEKVFSLNDGEEYRIFKFEMTTLISHKDLYGVKWLVPILYFSSKPIAVPEGGEIDSSDVVPEALGPAQIYIEKTFGNAEEEGISESDSVYFEQILSICNQKLGRGNVVFEGETIKPVSEDLPQVIEANYAKKLFHEKKNIVFEGETLNNADKENPQTLEANYAKKLIQNSKGYVLLENDTFQDRLNNIYYEKDGFKSEGILFYKANHEAYPLDANLELNLSPIYVGGVCFVTGFYEFDSTQAPDIYVQEEFLISSDFLSSNATGVFYREIYVRKSTEHPSGYIGVREEATQQGRYYFTAITDATVIGKIRTLIQNLDRNMVSQSQLDETNRNIDKKVDKKTTSGNYVYTHIGEVQGEAKLSEGAEDNAVVQRTVGGYVYVPNTYPSEQFPNVAMGSVAVSKFYVDSGVGLIQGNLIGEILPSEEENGYKQVLTFKGLKGEDGTALTLFTAELSLPKTSLEITEDSSLFKYTFTLKDSKGNTLSTKTIDLPLEELVVNGSYNNVTKSIVLTLKNGNSVDIPVGDLVEGLVNSTDLQNALSTKVDKVSGKGLSTNDLTNELVAKINSALQEHQPLDNYATLEQVNAKYTKPSTGIPKTDLDSSVQSSLGKLDGLANIKTIGDNLTLDGQGKLSATVQETVVDNKTIAKNAQGELYVKEFTYNNITMTPSELVQANTITFLEDGE